MEVRKCATDVRSFVAFGVSLGRPLLGCLIALSVSGTGGVATAAETSTTLSSSRNPSTVGQSVTLTARIKALGGGAPTGTMTFRNGADAMGSPVAVDTIGVGKSIAAGIFHTCALTDAAGVKCWGYNSVGQLGNNATTDSAIPVDVTGLGTGVVAIVAGNHHTCALTAAGGVKCWGGNIYGQLGNGATTDSATPVDVTDLATGAVTIAAGSSHTCALTGAGGAKCWGWGLSGRLGNNATTDSSIPVDVTGLGTGVVAIAAGSNHTCAQTAAGSGKCWGNNSLGQLGDGTTTQRSTPVDVSGLSALLFGKATLTTSALAVGSHSLTAEYSGDAGHDPSTSDTLVQVVNRFASSLALTSSVNPSLLGEPVTFEAALSTTGTPIGALTILVNGAAVQSGSGASLSFQTSALAVGSHTVTATYAGDDNTEPASASPLTQEVAIAPTATRLRVRPETAIPGRTVRLITTVLPRAPATGVPAGTVTFLNGQTLLGTASLDAGGRAVFEAAALPIGSHRLTARYEGNAEFAASGSRKRTVTVDPRIGSIIPVDGDSDPNQATNSKDFPAVAAFPAGGFVVVWQSTAQDGLSASVYARLYARTGVPLGDEFQVGAGVGASQWRPSVAAAAGRAFLVVWESSGPDGHAIYGQRYRDASPVGATFRIGTGDLAPAPDAAPLNGVPQATATATPVVAALAGGGFVVAWASDRQDGSGRDVYARRYAANAKPAGDEFMVNHAKTNDQWQPAVAALGDGGFVVTWSSNAKDEAITGVFGQRYGAAGEKAGPQFRVMALKQHRTDPAVAGLADGDFVVAFSARQGTLEEVHNIQARRYDGVSALGSAFAVNTARNHYQFAPRTAAVGDGGFIVTWTFDNGGGSEIHARLYDAQGEPQGAVFRIDEATPDLSGGMPSVARLANGRVVIVWQSRNTTTQATRIQAQRLDLKGTLPEGE